VLVIGDFTAELAIRRGKSEVRGQLSAQQVAENAGLISIKLRPILDLTPGRLEIRYNSGIVKVGFGENFGTAGDDDGATDAG